MPRISIAVPPQGRMIELDTDDGWMKVNYQQGGGAYHYFFDSGATDHTTKMDNLRLWFLGHKGKDLAAAVPELTEAERALILEGAK